MAQIKTGLRKILEVPIVYTSMLKILGADRVARQILRSLDLQDGMSLLDVGCGPGNFAANLNPSIKYFGFDFQEEYIEAARRKYSSHFQFIHSDINTFDFKDLQFDRIIILGVLHHLEDNEVDRLFGKLANVLLKGGRLICLENCFHDGQNPISKKIIEMDRGRNVRTIEGYRTLMEKHFLTVDPVLHTDLLRIPYSHVIFSCSH